MFYFACPVPSRPAGGVEKIYQFAGALAQAGIRSEVVHPAGSGPMRRWFDSPTPSRSADDTFFDLDHDILVIPAFMASQFEIPEAAKFIILDQGPYFNSSRLPLPESLSPIGSIDKGLYTHQGLLAVVCVSADSERYLKFSFPELNVQRIHVGIDSAVFFPGDIWRERALACMPRRRQDEIGELFRILASRGRCSEWVPQLIQGVDHHGVSRAFRSSPIFLNFPIREGFPLPPLEAMASGCIVIGYSGRGGDEYFLPEYTFKIPEGDSIEYARVVETVVAEYEGRSSQILKMASAATEFVRSEYSLERQERDVVEVFAPLQLSSEPRRLAGSSLVPMTQMLSGVRPKPHRARVAAHHAREAFRALIPSGQGR